jgi:hypothetical protein
MKGYEIARSLNVDPATVSKDIPYLAAQSQNYWNDLKIGDPLQINWEIGGVTKIETGFTRSNTNSYRSITS